MSHDYTRNHYVPVWHQKQFIPPTSPNKELFHLDLTPPTFTDGRGVNRYRKAIRRLGPKKCFVEHNLYTTILGGRRSTDVERSFFGQIDDRGREAVLHFGNFSQNRGGASRGFQDLMTYMSTQRLRTPKGMGWLQNDSNTADKNVILLNMQLSKNLFAAIWTESVWLIADATHSSTKFIVSDHPVTTYNRALRPLSPQCRGFNDPDIRMNGTHTIFPLSSEKVLILTNRSWVLNPYQSPTSFRPNPVYERDAIFNLLEIQSERHLAEQEVREINFIIKRRAYRYIAAAQEEWLFPERHVSLGQWNNYGHGYLCMPDPRSVAFRGAVLVGYRRGRSDGFDPYGRRPGQPGFSVDPPQEQAASFYNFQGEFARLFGPRRRGRTFEFGRLDDEDDSPELHRSYLRQEIRRRRS